MDVGDPICVVAGGAATLVAVDTLGAVVTCGAVANPGVVSTLGGESVIVVARAL